MNWTNKYIVWSVFLISVIIIIIGVFGLLELGVGEEHDSLLDFTCEELETKDISYDGSGGRFVTDWASNNWVSDELINEAMIEKGCVSNETNKFHYKSLERL